MKTINNNINVRGEFFAPVAVALQQSEYSRNCHGFSDVEHIESGIGRALNSVSSGRGWVQDILMKLGVAVSVSNFFAALKSERRRKLVEDIEKSFDEIKNKTFEKKAWANNDNAKRQQSMFIALAHNLMRMLEIKLECEEGVVDCISAKDQLKRIAEDIITTKNAGRIPNPLVSEWRRCTQRSFRFIRWLVFCSNDLTSWGIALNVLRPLMTKPL